MFILKDIINILKEFRINSYDNIFENYDIEEKYNLTGFIGFILSTLGIIYLLFGNVTFLCLSPLFIFSGIMCQTLMLDFIEKEKNG